MSLPSRHSAARRRLLDTPAQRWAWAIASAIPLFGLPALVRQGVTRRTVTPAVYGITALGAASFALAVTVPVILPSGPFTAGRGGGGALGVGFAMAAFALGHRAGQERDAREARKWLELEG